MVNGELNFRNFPAVLALLLILAVPAFGVGDGAETEWELKTKQGYRHLETAEYGKALRSFDEALRLNPRAASSKTGKGVALARQGSLEEAEELLREALALNPDPCRTHYELGLIYQQKGDHQKAVNEFKLGIEKCRDRMATQ